jgi:hypothetical protein
MDSAALRAVQTPIKERYKSDPQAALITLKAKGTPDDANIASKVETGRALAVAGLHPDAPQEKLDQLLKLTERYRVVYQTIRNGPPVALTMQRTQAA